MPCNPTRKVIACHAVLRLDWVPKPEVINTNATSAAALNTRLNCEAYPEVLLQIQAKYQNSENEMKRRRVEPKDTEIIDFLLTISIFLSREITTMVFGMPVPEDILEFNTLTTL